MVRWLEQQGFQAGSFKTEFGDRDDAPSEIDPGHSASVLEPDADAPAA
jgi:hypothetical protein